MPIQINIQQLGVGQEEVSLKGELPAAELDLGLSREVVLAQHPLAYELVVQKFEDALLVQGSLSMVFDCHCVRCLREVRSRLDLPEWTCHLPLSGEDAVPVSNDSVDLTPHIREDILLEFPQYPVCKPECSGLAGSPQGKPKPDGDEEGKLPTSAWTELDKLKL